MPAQSQSPPLLPHLPPPCPGPAEMVEWCGWALAAWPSLPAAAFAAFTFCNLAPRGWRHHLWYKQRFPRYPKSRRAVIPFLW